MYVSADVPICAETRAITETPSDSTSDAFHRNNRSMNMTDEELDEELESLTDEDIENPEGDDLMELIERVYGEQEEHEEPERPKLNLSLHEGETSEQGIARIALDPKLRAATAILSVKGMGFTNEDLDINALIEELNKQTEQVKKKDLSRSEEMLTAQAHTLDLLFNKLVINANRNMSEGFLEATDTYFKLAMKAQTQCRTTWEAISKIQNPPIANYAKQLNVAHNQQINNGQEIENPPNELLEKTYGQQLDTRAQGEAVKADSTVEALEEIHRSKDD